MALRIPTFVRYGSLMRSGVTDEILKSFDTIVFVSQSFKQFAAKFPQYSKSVEKFKTHIANFESPNNNTIIVDDTFSPSKLVYTATGPLNEDYDDVRAYREATLSGLQCAHSLGSRRLLIASVGNVFKNQVYVAAAAAMDTDYLPPDVRESQNNRFEAVSFLCENETDVNAVNQASLHNMGKTVMKDIGGGECEQATAQNIAQYVKQLFKDLPLKIRIFNNDQIKSEFPLLSAVDRANELTDRHKGCVLEIEYCPTESVKETIFLVGKGITYDTGGVDLKVHGMRLMTYDKCGAGAVAGIMKIAAEKQPKETRIVGLMALTRNNIGPGAYVTDEIIKSRSGVKVCIGNTDAEGRMAMADVLCYAKEKALSALNPKLFTIATLTGHVGLVYGAGYAAIVQNGPALDLEIGSRMHELSFELGDPIELSSLRKEDYEFVMYKGDRAAIMQCNEKPSSGTSRGHNFPAAFLIYTSGLDKHDRKSNCPLPYCHLDIASAVTSPKSGFMDHPAAATIATLANMFVK